MALKKGDYVKFVDDKTQIGCGPYIGIITDVCVWDHLDGFKTYSVRVLNVESLQGLVLKSTLERLRKDPHIHGYTEDCLWVIDEKEALTKAI